MLFHFKTNLLCLVLLTLAFLSSCQKDSHKPSPATPQPAGFNGPSDGGGGDTCNGKMIESYKVNIKTLPEYQEFIEPILDEMDSSIEVGKGTKNVFSKFFLNPELKSWYLIDCKLQDLPKDKKGLYLESHQTARHTEKEVFIDALSYQKMEKSEKAKLLLHEMVMGYYLIRYKTIKEICQLADACTGDHETANKWKMMAPQPYRQLNGEDHQRIRNLTAWIWESRGNFKAKDFDQMLAKNDFDPRFRSFSQSGEDNGKWIEVEVSTLLRMFKKYQWSKKLPQNCHFPVDSFKSQTKCDSTIKAELIEFEVFSQVKMKFLKVTISMTRQSDQKTFAGDFFYAVYGDKHKVRLHLSRFGEFLKKGSVFVMTERHLGIKAEEIVEGGKEKFLSFILNMEKENEPELFQVAYVTQVWYDIETFEEEVDGEMGKSTYVHTSTLQNESEILFFEDELLMGQFHSQFMNGRTRRLFQQKPKSDPDLKDRPN